MKKVIFSVLFISALVVASVAQTPVNTNKLTVTADDANGGGVPNQIVINRASNASDQLLLGYHDNNYGSIQAITQGVGMRPLVFNPLGGNVGIGTKNPGAKLQVAGGKFLAEYNNGQFTAAQLDDINNDLGASGIVGNFAGDLYLRSYWGMVIDRHGGNSNNAGYTNGINPDGGSFAVRYRTSPTNFRTDFLINGNGNVGIGTTNPQHLLEVTNNSGIPSLGIRGNLDSKLIFEPNDGSDRFIIWANMSGYTNEDKLRFQYKNPSPNGPVHLDGLVMTGEGKLGVGTATPTEKLEVAGKIKATELELTNGSSHNLNVNDADADPSNEIQTLTLSGSTLSISNGNSVQLPANSDSQSLSLNGSTLSISNGNSVEIVEKDSDPSNEIQNLSLSGSTLSISNGNSVEIVEKDSDPSNEIQNLTLSGNTLSISNGNSVNLPIVTGTAVIGPSSGGLLVGPDVYRFEVPFNLPPFTSPPHMVVTVRGERYPDTFVATIVDTYPDHFTIQIRRVDCPSGCSWDQSLKLNWMAFQ